jgi:aminopeptidase
VGTIEQGVKQAVENCLKIQAGENVVIITDQKTLEVGSAFQKAIDKITDEIQFFVMEDFGQRPIDFPHAIESAISIADVSIYAAQGAEGELQSFRRFMIEAVEANKKLRHAHMIGITPQIMRDGMCSDYREIQRISRLVYDKVKDAGKIRVVTEKGGDFLAEFSPGYKWIISDGDITPSLWHNLPDGEVLTSPVNCNGMVVIDGCLGDFFDERYASLELIKELTTYIFDTDENSDRIGEFAIGTNTGLTKLIYNILQDEKFPGVHIAFGSPCPTRTGAHWDSKAHVDGVIKNPTIYVDGEIIMNKGRFCIKN